MNSSSEPMDVDLSGNSQNNVAMDISSSDLDSTLLGTKIEEEYVETNDENGKGNFDTSESKISNEIPTTTTTKRFTIKITQRREHTFSNTSISFILITLSLLSLLMYHILKFECSGELNLTVIKKSLYENVIGQSEAIEYIIESLEENSKQPSQSSKLLLLYGGTGVGKTLTISHILENLHHCANIYHYTMPSFIDTFTSELMLGLTFCPTSMIIVDDLYRTDMHIKEHIKEIFKKSENLGKKITIILVFNCDIINEQYVKKCEDSFNLDLQQEFKELKGFKRFIKFKSLTENDLRKCIEKELESKILHEAEFENIVKHFNVSVDGCKGVYTKVKLLNIK